jgi:uncharacterized protein
LDTDFARLIAIGFLAQTVDGALGMAFGVISTTAMLAVGVPPAQASAIVHTAEVFTTGASAASHIYYRNVDWRLVARLGIAGTAGAGLGAWILSNVDAQAARPYVVAYLTRHGRADPFAVSSPTSPARRPRAMDTALGLRCWFSRCEWWGRLGTDLYRYVDWIRPYAAHDRRLGQRH